MSDHKLYQLPEITCLKLRFKLLAQRPCHLPAFKGSMLRGAFGHALRRTVCVMGPGQPCDTCMLKRQCIYTRLFETFVHEAPPRFLQGVPTAPRPYVFEPFDTETFYAEGSPLLFDLLLIGQATELYPYAIYGVECMAQTGLGHARHRFRLAGVDWLQTSAATEEANGWHKLYDGQERQLVSDAAPQAPAPTNGHALDHETQLRFLTPTRLKFRNELTVDFTFRMLVFKMLRRVLELAHFHMPGADINWEFHELLVAADALQVMERNLTWSDWQRRSNRQQTSMKMGGFVGTMTLAGEVAPFTDLLQVSELVHVGKGAVFGNGKIRANTKTPLKSRN